MKDLIFISHSTHQDDYCSAWLAAKLKGIGYNVWLDLNDLSAGDSFNTVIKPIIQNEARVFIAITTKSYSEKSDNQNSGVTRELNCASTIDTKQLGHNFIIPVKFDDVDYNSFPYHYIGWNAIDFSKNWQVGLIDLVKELEKIDIKKSQLSDDPIALWFEAIKAENKVLDRQEKYFSNWLPFDLPEHIFLHEPDYFRKEDFFDFPFSFITDSNRLLTFTSETTVKQFTSIKKSFKLKTVDFITKQDFDFEEFILKETRIKLVWLLNNTIQKHLTKCNLICWRRGNSKLYYFRTPKESTGEFINLKRYNKPKGRRAITGQVNPIIDDKKLLVNWALGLIPKAELEPFPHYRVNYSLVFSDENNRRYEKTLHHKLRRAVPVDWYNRKWFETLLASFLKISPSFDSDKISIEIDKDIFWNISNEPFNGIIEKGYIEPNDES